MAETKIVITSRAQTDIAECASFVLNVSKDAAQKLSDNIYSSIESLGLFPEKNPIFEMNQSFPLTIRKQIVDKRYLILYAVEKNEIVIYRVLDSRRKFESLIW